MFGNFSPTEKKLFVLVAVSDHDPASPIQPVANRLLYADYLFRLGDHDVAEAITKCCLIPDRQPMAVHAPEDEKFVTKAEAQAFLRTTYRKWLGVVDVSMKLGFPIAVLDESGQTVDVLEYVTTPQERPASRAFARAR